MYTSIAIELTIRCPDCGGQIPVTRLGDTISCPGCAQSTSATWRGALDVTERGATFSLLEILPGLKTGDKMTGTPLGGRILVEIAEASCSCGAVFPLESIKKMSRHRPGLTCSECGEKSAGRRPGDAFVEAYPAACYVIGEIDPDRFEASASRGIVVVCAQCNAALDTSEPGPATCNYCGAVNQIPQPATGAARAHRLYVLFAER